MKIGSSSWAFNRSGFYPGMGHFDRRRRRRSGMGDLKSDLLSLAKGGVGEVTSEVKNISKQLQATRTLLIVSTGAAVASALVAIFRR